jgi:membrane protease YdiL (CAAX protease family)
MQNKSIKRQRIEAHATPMDETKVNRKEKARRGLTVYFALLVAGTAFFEWKILRTGESIDKLPGLVFALMYVPAIASIGARLALREGFGDVSFRLGKWEGMRSMVLAWIYPIVVGFLAYGMAWAASFAKFQRPLPPQSHLYVNSPAINFFESLSLMATLGTLASGLSAFGEELGWRGYMLTRLIAAGVPRPVLFSGLIWALWHVPLILSGQYAAGARPEVSAMLFVIGVVADACLAAYVRLRSGSIWPAVMLHAAWNAVIQGTFDRATVGASWAVGESGVLTVSVSLVFVLVATRGPWKFYRRPSEPLLL